MSYYVVCKNNIIFTVMYDNHTSVLIAIHKLTCLTSGSSSDSMVMDYENYDGMSRVVCTTIKGNPLKLM